MLDRLRAALRRRLRPVRQRQDGAQGERQQVHGRPDARLRAALQPVRLQSRPTCATWQPTRERRQRRAGQRDRAEQQPARSACRCCRSSPIPTDSAREYDLETSVAIQHELIRGLSVSGSWFRRSTHNERRTDNLLVGASDYSRSMSSARSTDRCSRSTTWTPASAASTTRSTSTRRTATSGRASTTASSSACPAGCTARRSSAAGRSINWSASSATRSTTRTTTVPLNPQRRRTAYLGWCDQGKLDIPYRHEFKLSGSYTHPVGHPGQRGVAELRRADPRHLLEHRPRRRRYAAELHRPVHAGCARHSRIS